MAWWLIFGALAAIGVAGWLNRSTLKGCLRPANLRAYLKSPVILTRGHTVLYTALVGLAIASTIVTSAVNRRELNREREARLKTITAQLVTMDRLATVESRQRAYSRLQARLAQPSVAERNRENLQAIEACGRSNACRGLFASFVRTVVRTDTRTGDIIPAPPSKGPGGTVTVPRPAPSGPPQIIPVPGRPGKDGAQGPEGKPGKNVDSAIVDGLENRIADVERALANVLGRLPGVDRVLALLCRPPLRICG